MFQTVLLYFYLTISWFLEINVCGKAGSFSWIWESMTFSQPGDDPRFKMKHYSTLHNKKPFHQPLRKRKMFQLNLRYQHQRWLHTHFHILKKLFDINYGCHIIFLHIECNLRPIPLTGSWTSNKIVKLPGQ